MSANKLVLPSGRRKFSEQWNVYSSESDDEER